MPQKRRWSIIPSPTAGPQSVLAREAFGIGQSRLPMSSYRIAHQIHHVHNRIDSGAKADGNKCRARCLAPWAPFGPAIWERLEFVAENALRKPRQRLIDLFVPYLRERGGLFWFDRSSAMARAERGYTGGYTAVTAILRNLRPPPSPGLDVRFETPSLTSLSICRSFLGGNLFFQLVNARYERGARQHADLMPERVRSKSHHQHANPGTAAASSRPATQKQSSRSRRRLITEISYLRNFTSAHSIGIERWRPLEAKGATPQSKGPNDLGDDGEIGLRPVAEGSHPASLAERSLLRQIRKVGAECLNGARSDLCGGRGETRVPTAICWE
jgi:hypothetical protein